MYDTNDYSHRFGNFGKIIRIEFIEIRTLFTKFNIQSSGKVRVAGKIEQIIIDQADYNF